MLNVWLEETKKREDLEHGGRLLKSAMKLQQRSVNLLWSV